MTTWTSSGYTAPMLRFAICPECKISMTLPEDYVSFSPWLAAHSKVCPGGKIHMVAKVKKPKGKPPSVSPDVNADAFAAKVGAKAAHALVDEALKIFFKGKVK